MDTLRPYGREARDGRWLEAASIVLVRQRPGSARGVMFITLEDEIGVVNLTVCPQLFDQNRRTILSAGMIAVPGRVQREGRVVHLVAQRLPISASDRRAQPLFEVRQPQAVRR